MPKGKTTRLVGLVLSGRGKGLKVMHPAFRRCPGHCSGSLVRTFVPRGSRCHCSTGSLVRCFARRPARIVILVGPSGPSNGFVPRGSVLALTR